VDIEQIRQTMLLVKDVTDSLSKELEKNTQALAGLSSSFVRLIEAVENLPNKEDFRSLIKEHVKDHEVEITKTLTSHNNECSSRASTAIEREIQREKDFVAEIKEAVSEATKPTQEMISIYRKVIWTVGIAITLGTAMFGYLHHAMKAVGVQ